MKDLKKREKLDAALARLKAEGESSKKGGSIAYHHAMCYSTSLARHEGEIAHEVFLKKYWNTEFSSFVCPSCGRSFTYNPIKTSGMDKNDTGLDEKMLKDLDDRVSVSAGYNGYEVDDGSRSYRLKAPQIHEAMTEVLRRIKEIKEQGISIEVRQYCSDCIERGSRYADVVFHKGEGSDIVSYPRIENKRSADEIAPFDYYIVQSFIGRALGDFEGYGKKRVDMRKLNATERVKLFVEHMDNHISFEGRKWSEIIDIVGRVLGF